MHRFSSGSFSRVDWNPYGWFDVPGEMVESENYSMWNVTTWCYSDAEYIREFSELAGISGEILPCEPSINLLDPDSTGIDLNSPYKVVVDPFSSEVVNTFLRFDLPTRAFLWPRSRSSHLIGGGVIERSYTGPIRVRVINYSAAPLVINIGEPLCQMMIDRDGQPELYNVRDISKVTARGDKGGITGIGMTRVEK